MYNSIQHFYEFGVCKIEEKIRDFIINQKDIGDLVYGLQDELFELGRNIIQEVLEDMDAHIKNLGIRKKNWTVVRKAESDGLLTSFGNLFYERTYYQSKKDGTYKYLVDDIVGIGPRDKVTADVIINAVDEASESSYEKGGRKASFVEQITKQAVMKKIHELQIVEPKEKPSEKKQVKLLYIEADEDHVSLQSKKGPETKIMPKMIYVHEGLDPDKSTKSRKVLLNRKYFGGVYRENEELWLEVSEYIDEHYDMDTIETIYISGDGASWIKTGLDWIPKSKYVLDNYHMNRYLKQATAHLKESSAYWQTLIDALEWPDKESATKIFDRIIEKTEIETKKKAVCESKRYILNNWDGIAIKAEKRYEIIGCSAEGHVSHLFSDRLSSRPRGWSVIGVEKMAKLRIYKMNGGNVYDIVMGQKKKEKKTQKDRQQDELIKQLRTSAKRYNDSYNGSIPIVDKGKVTGAYKALKNIIGQCS